MQNRVLWCWQNQLYLCVYVLKLWLWVLVDQPFLMSCPPLELHHGKVTTCTQHKPLPKCPIALNSNNNIAQISVITPAACILDVQFHHAMGCFWFFALSRHVDIELLSSPSIDSTLKYYCDKQVSINYGHKTV